MKTQLLCLCIMWFTFSACNRRDFIGESSALSFQTIELLKFHAEYFLKESHNNRMDYHNLATSRSLKFNEMLNVLMMLQKHNEGYHHLRNKMIPEGYFSFKADKTSAIKTVTALTEYLSNNNDSIFLYMKNILLEDFTIYGLKENEIVGSVERIEKEYNRFVSVGSSKNIITPRANIPLINQTLLAIENIEREKNRIIANTVKECIGHNNIRHHYGWTFPVVHTEELPATVGEVFTATISIGSYSSPFDPDYTIFVVNKTDTLRYSEEFEGAKYQKEISKKGKNVLDIQYFETNPLTGEVLTGQGQYTFYVY